MGFNSGLKGLITYLLHRAESFMKVNRFSVSQEIPHILRNPKFHYHSHKCSPPVPILSQFDAVHAAHIPLLEYPSLYYNPI